MMLAAFLGFVAGFCYAVVIYEFVHISDLTTRTDIIKALEERTE